MSDFTTQSDIDGQRLIVKPVCFENIFCGLCQPVACDVFGLIRWCFTQQQLPSLNAQILHRTKMEILVIPIIDALVVIRTGATRDATICCAVLLLADIVLNLGATLQGKRPVFTRGCLHAVPSRMRRSEPRQPHLLAGRRLTHVFVPCRWQ